MSIAPDILIVIATLFTGFGLASMIATWVDRRFPLLALITLLATAGVFYYAYQQIEDPQGWREIPNAFISVVARLLN